nr:hypothetical protein CISIN_1g018683mg [Ipomoea batatas]
MVVECCFPQQRCGCYGKVRLLICSGLTYGLWMEHAGLCCHGCGSTFDLGNLGRSESSSFSIEGVDCCDWRWACNAPRDI